MSSVSGSFNSPFAWSSEQKSGASRPTRAASTSPAPDELVTAASVTVVAEKILNSADSRRPIDFLPFLLTTRVIARELGRASAGCPANRALASRGRKEADMHARQMPLAALLMATAGLFMLITAVARLNALSAGAQSTPAHDVFVG